MKDNKKKKKHGKLIFFLIILIGILIVLGYMIYTGAWNPFKSNDVSKEAKISYENNVNDSKDILNITDSEENINYIENDTSENNPFNPKTGISPYGFRVKDYGANGKNGVLLEKQATYENYYNKFGGYLYIKYMKNYDYSNEYFIKKKNSMSIIDEKNLNEKTKIILGYEGNDLTFYILEDCKIYEFFVADTDLYDNSQNLFNTLNINYQIPSKDKLNK